MRCVVPLILIILLFLRGTCPLVQAAGEPASSAAEMLPDAELHDVLFLDPDRGWAVGDRGVIWQTDNGGRRWQLVDSPTNVRLRSIYFVDAQHGWIAGGWIHPGTQRSSALLLRTDNGGKKWVTVELPMLPALRQIHFKDTRNGWALGDSSSLYAVGYFRTNDGGSTWESTPAGIPLSMSVAASLRDARPSRGDGPPVPVTGEKRDRALLIAADSSIWSMANGKLTLVTQRDELGIYPRAVRFSGKRGWLVGDRGAILGSAQNGGNFSWAPPTGKIPEGLADEFDWKTVATHEDQCWIAGIPGSLILHSPDSGRSWRAIRTNQTAPINQLYFCDEHHGWAVGAMGRILATRDGGQNWRVQHSGGERTGLLAMHGLAESVPLEILAKATADEGHLAVTAVFHSAPETGAAATTQDDRLREACSAVGVSFTETISQKLRWAGSTSDPSSRRSGDSVERLEREIVRQLRIWRPDVVLTDNISPQGAQPEGQLVGQAVLQAVQRAGDPAVYPDQIVVAGLQPWTIRKLLSVVPAQESPNVTVDTSRLSMQLACSLADFIVPARGIVSPSITTSPKTVGCRLLWSQAAQEVANRDIFSGVPPALVGESRRPARTPPPSRVEALTRTAQQLRHLQEISAAGSTQQGKLATALPQIEQLAQGHEPAMAGRLLYRLAQQFLASGDYAAANACFSALTERFPDHALNDAALLWMIRYQCSLELQHAFGSRRIIRLPSVAENAPRSGKPVEGVQPASFTGAPFPLVADELPRAVQIAEQIRQTRPALYADPRVQFPLVSVQRRLDNTTETSRLLNVLVGSQLTPVWRSVARYEQRRFERQQLAEPRSAYPNLSAVVATTKPVLDGDLNDVCWQSGAWTSFPSSNSGPSTQVMVTHDREHIFIALRCANAIAGDAAAIREPRVRDASLLDRDRVEMHFDVDRDYQTHYQLAVDQRGWTNDACGDDLKWNPQWYVAAASSNAEWRIEAAIPRAELGTTSNRGEAWCVRFRRIVPHQEYLSWPEASATTIPLNDFALLVFSDMP